MLDRGVSCGCHAMMLSAAVQQDEYPIGWGVEESVVLQGTRTWAGGWGHCATVGRQLSMLQVLCNRGLSGRCHATGG